MPFSTLNNIVCTKSISLFVYFNFISYFPSKGPLGFFNWYISCQGITSDADSNSNSLNSKYYAGLELELEVRKNLELELELDS